MKRYLAPHVIGVLLLVAWPASAQDRVGLSFSTKTIATADTVAAGSPVTIYLVAFLADRTEGLTGFSCRVDWNHDALADLVWQPPVETGREGLISATFPQPVFPVDRGIVLATAVCAAAPADTASVWLVGTPFLTGTVGMGRDVPVGGKAGRRLYLGFPDPEDLGPPGAPGKPTLN
jgi:hypothetical protein